MEFLQRLSKFISNTTAIIEEAADKQAAKNIRLKEELSKKSDEELKEIVKSDSIMISDNKKDFAIIELKKRGIKIDT